MEFAAPSRTPVVMAESSKSVKSGAVNGKSAKSSAVKGKSAKSNTTNGVESGVSKRSKRNSLAKPPVFKSAADAAKFIESFSFKK